MQSINNMKDLGIYQKHYYGNDKGHLIEVRESKVKREYYGTLFEPTPLGVRSRLFEIEGVSSVDGAFEAFESQAKIEIDRLNKIAEEEKKKLENTKKNAEVVEKSQKTGVKS